MLSGRLPPVFGFNCKLATLLLVHSAVLLCISYWFECSFTPQPSRAGPFSIFCMVATSGHRFRQPKSLFRPQPCNKVCSHGKLHPKLHSTAVKIVNLCVQTFCRKFCWHSLMLWPEDMPPATTISLSAHDDLVPRDLVLAQLEASPLPAKVMVHPTAGHGGYLLDQQWQENLIQEVKTLASTRA